MCCGLGCLVGVVGSVVVCCFCYVLGVMWWVVVCYRFGFVCVELFRFLLCVVFGVCLVWWIRDVG